MSDHTNRRPDPFEARARAAATAVGIDPDHRVPNPDKPGKTMPAWTLYAALDPEFQKQGLSLEMEFCGDEDDRIVKASSIADFNRLIKAVDEGVYFDGATPVFVTGEGVRLEGFDAAAMFFGIAHSEACRLFDPASYGWVKVTPAMVIKRVREVMAQHTTSAAA